MPPDSGFDQADVQESFLRARRRQMLAQLAHRLRREPDDVNDVIPYDEVIDALGMTGQHYVGLQNISLDSIVGTVDSRRDFDRRFRPTSSRVRERWEKLALAQQRGEVIPPIDVFRIGDLHFVKDGHHRVSVALASRRTTIDAYVTTVETAVPAKDISRRGDLLIKSYERVFGARVPLPREDAVVITVTDPWTYAELGAMVEAWGFRWMQDERRFIERDEVARRWFTEEYVPVVRILREADLLGEGTDAEAYVRVSRERYRLIRTHEWNDDVIRRLQTELG